MFISQIPSLPEVVLHVAWHTVCEYVGCEAQLERDSTGLQGACTARNRRQGI